MNTKLYHQQIRRKTRGLSANGFSSALQLQTKSVCACMVRGRAQRLFEYGGCKQTQKSINNTKRSKGWINGMDEH